MKFKKKKNQKKLVRKWSTYLNACRRVVMGEPSLICPKLYEFCPFNRHVSKRFLGGSLTSATGRGRTASSSSSNAGRRRLRSSNKK